MTSLHSLTQSAMLGSGNDPNALLIAAARSGIGELGGFLPINVEGTQNPCPAETRAYMPPAAAELLKRILAGEFDATLSEFLHLAAVRGLLVPPEAIPSLLGLGKKELRSSVMQVIGERGKWLAERNPSWAYALGRDPFDAWEHGARLERIAALEQIRAEEPAKARAWLQSAWEQDSPEDRAAFLATFSNGLSMDDELFLESCLDDKRKEVRDVARGLLLRLEDSHFVQRNWARAKALVKFESKLLGKDAIHVILPEEPDPAAKRDGLGGAPLRRKLGIKANRLAQILSFVPPALWSREFGRSPDKLIAAALDCEWKEPLLLGWQLAIQAAHDVDWAEALAPLWAAQRDGWSVLDGNDMENIIMLMRAEKVEDLAQSSIKPRVAELNDKNPLVLLLEKYRRPWTENLARTVVQSAQRQSGGMVYMLPMALPGYAYWIPPELANEFGSGWAAEPKGYWPDKINDFLMILNFRHEIQEALSK